MHPRRGLGDPRAEAEPLNKLAGIAWSVLRYRTRFDEAPAAV
jgi:hypothetical protein